jgi:phage terminase large subunit
MSANVDIKRNKIHYQFLGQNCRYYYEMGGRWSAKTTEILIHILCGMYNYDNLKVAVFRKTYESIRDSVYADMCQLIFELGLDNAFVIGKAPFSIRCRHNDSYCIFKGAQEPERLKGLAGIHWVFLEELNEFTQQDFETIDQGIRGKGIPHKIFMAHNPVPRIPGEMYWFERLFTPRPIEAGKIHVFNVKTLGRVAALKTTYQHNAFTPKHVRQRLEGYRYTNPSLYKLWTLGEYTEIKGAVLTNWDEVTSVPAGAPFIGYGLDFGFAQDPVALVAIWGNRDEIWIKGLIYKTNMTNRELAAEMRRLKIDPYARIVADSAEPKSIEDLFREGFRGIRGVKKRANYKEDMANVLQGMKIHIVSGSIDLRREISIWSWSEDKNGKLLPKLRDGDDHYMDATVMLMHDYRGSRKMSVKGV